MVPLSDHAIVPASSAAAMIPRLALGIPGEALTAMMLSVFYVHNVIPGPQLFQNNIDLVYGLYFALIALNVIVMIFLLFATILAYLSKKQIWASVKPRKD